MKYLAVLFGLLTLFACNSTDNGPQSEGNTVDTVYYGGSFPHKIVIDDSAFISTWLEDMSSDTAIKSFSLRESAKAYQGKHKKAGLTKNKDYGWVLDLQKESVEFLAFKKFTGKALDCNDTSLGGARGIFIDTLAEYDYYNIYNSSEAHVTCGIYIQRQDSVMYQFNMSYFFGVGFVLPSSLRTNLGDLIIDYN
jgi:hypothetical protein